MVHVRTENWKRQESLWTNAKRLSQDKVKHVKNNNELNFVLFSNFFNLTKKKKERRKKKKMKKPMDIFDFHLLSGSKRNGKCCITRNICVSFINNKLWTLYIWPIEPERRIKVFNFAKITIIGSIQSSSLSP